MMAHYAWFARLAEFEQTDLAISLLALLREVHRFRLQLASDALVLLRIGYDVKAHNGP
jgi:hypothetical protein